MKNKPIKPVEHSIYVLVDLFRDMLWNIQGPTYPVKTLQRRILNLTPQDMIRVEKHWVKLMNALEEIDTIIADRAEKDGDEWP